MGCSLMLQIKQCLALVGGATESLFPQVEALLLGETDYQEALEYVAARKKMDRYHSVIDFIFCELHPEWRMSCRRYYEGNGQQLCGQITTVQLMEYNRRLLKALEVARETFAEKRRENWTSYREQTELRLAA